MAPFPLCFVRDFPLVSPIWSSQRPGGKRTRNNIIIFIIFSAVGEDENEQSQKTIEAKPKNDRGKTVKRSVRFKRPTIIMRRNPWGYISRARFLGLNDIHVLPRFVRHGLVKLVRPYIRGVFTRPGVGERGVYNRREQRVYASFREWNLINHPRNRTPVSAS